MTETRWTNNREKVRVVLIEPLEAGGMRKKRNVSAEAHAALMDKLAERLAYMSEQGLEGLRDYLIRVAGKANVWPQVNHVLQYAWGIEVPPPRDNAYARSIMWSALGREAHEGGWHVELYQTAKRLGPPPSKYSRTVLRREADDNRHRVQVARERIDRGRATREDHVFLEAYQAVRREAEQFIEEGKINKERDHAVGANCAE